MDQNDGVNKTQQMQGDTYEFKHSEEVLNNWIDKNHQSLEILDREEAQIQADLVLRKEEKVQDLTEFLHNQNMMIHHKKLLCMSKSYPDMNQPSREIAEKVKACRRGEERFNTFVTKLFGTLL